MTLKEAIKELRRHNTFVRDCGYPALARAQKLGIEAMKRIQNARCIGYSVPADLLPQETKEV